MHERLELRLFRLQPQASNLKGVEMLELNIEGDFFDEKNDRFIKVEPRIVRLEHSLLSVSKWEAKFEKPFLDRKEKSQDEIRSYAKMMVIDDITNVEMDLVLEQLEKIVEYISSKQTATTIKTGPNRPNREIITSEIIYYWMSALNIPFEPCETWHLNRLLTLINVANIKSNPSGKKRSKASTSQMYRDLNAQRRARMVSAG